MKVAVVGREKVRMGFELAGVKESGKDLRELAERADIAVVFVEKEEIEKVGKRERRELESSTRPVFMVIEESDLEKIAKRVMGV